ncbi:MAG TPA: hypothetical protein VF520_03230 [Thermoleophilaceae bacterium]
MLVEIAAADRDAVMGIHHPCEETELVPAVAAVVGIEVGVVRAEVVTPDREAHGVDHSFEIPVLVLVRAAGAREPPVLMVADVEAWADEDRDPLLLTPGPVVQLVRPRSKRWRGYLIPGG